MTRPEDPKILQMHGVQMQAAPFDPIGPHVSNTAISSQTVLTPPVSPTGTADKIMIQSNDQATRYTLDGSLPMPTGTQHGFVLIADAAPIVIGISEGLTLTVVEATGTAELQYQWGQ